MNKTGYDQFFDKAKKTSSLEGQPVDIKKLNKKIQSQLKAKKEAKKTFPFVQFFGFIACVLSLFLLVENYDQVATYLSKIEVGLGSTASATSNNQQPNSSEATSAVTNEDATNENHQTASKVKNQEDTDYLFKLAERKKQLDQREEELNKKADEIAKQKLELEDKLKQIEESRIKISEMLRERISSDEEKINTLVQVYSNMKPVQAAKVFESLDEDLVIEILSRMKKQNAADILNLVKSDKAQVLSERYAGYRAPASEEKKKAEVKP